MLKQHDDLFIDDGSPILNAPPVKGHRPRRKPVAGDFYLCPRLWLDQAAEASGQYLILAIRLYRRWRMREPGTNWVAASAAALAGPGPGGGSGRHGRLRVLDRLEAAGLIKVVR